MRTTATIKEVFRSGTASERLLEAMLVFASLDEWLPWLAARQLLRITITKKDDDWLLVASARLGRDSQVAFQGGYDPEDAIVAFVHALCFGLVTWKKDKWGSMRSDKN